jgi:hypothetical protein
VSYSIQIVDQFHYHASVVFGLDVLASNSEFPLLVGCSLKTLHGEIVDVPARWIKSPGLALWEIRPGTEFIRNPDTLPINDRVMAGTIIFALWRNDSFTESLGDTGWIDWEAIWLIGSSTKSMDMQDEHIQRKYGTRRDVWIK